MKPATVAPAPGSIIETTTRTRTVSDAQPIDQKTPSLWAYLTEVDRKGDWAKHIVYIHRISPQPSVPVQKCQQWLTAPNGQRTAICDEQEVEFALMTYFGGGEYRLMVKNGAQLMTTGKLFIDAPVRPMPAPTDTTGFGPGVVTVNSGTGMGDAATIAGKAIDTIAGQDREGVRIGMDALATAANVVRSFGEGRPGAQDDMTRQFMALMMARLAQDPMEQMVKFFTLMREMGSAMGTAGPTGVPADIMQKMFAVMFERFINPSPSGAPVSASAELVRQLPQVGNTIVQGLQEFRLAMEAQRDAIKAQQLGPRAVPAQAGPSPQIIPPGPATNPAPANGAPSMEFVQKKIIEILSNPQLSAIQAADDVLTFLDTINDKIVDELALMGETGLMQLFQSQPILRPATQNSARLVEFIRAFLKMHADDVATELAGKAAQQPLPN